MYGGTPSYVRSRSADPYGAAEQPYGAAAQPYGAWYNVLASGLVKAGKAAGSTGKAIAADPEALEATFQIVGSGASIVQQRRAAKAAAAEAAATAKAERRAAKLMAKAQADAARAAAPYQAQAELAAAQSRGTIVAVAIAGGVALAALLMLRPKRRTGPPGFAVARNEGKKRIPWWVVGLGTLLAAGDAITPGFPFPGSAVIMVPAAGGLWLAKLAEYTGDKPAKKNGRRRRRSRR